MSRRRFPLPGSSRLTVPTLVTLLSAALLAGPVLAAPGAVTGATPRLDDPGATASDPSTGPTGPSIVYEQWLEHQADHIDFTPGGRVSVPFRPRVDDASPVDGAMPRPLPAGRASGAQMAASAQGSRWAVVPGVAAPDGSSAGPTGLSGPPIDRPAVDPSTVIAATDSVARVPVAAPTVADLAATGLRREVFGFLPYWEVNASTTTLVYSRLSTIAYFGVGADKSGNLIKKNADGSTSTGWAGWTSAKLTSDISAAHKAGTRVVLTLQSFAWTTGQANTQAALLGSSTARLNLAKQAAAAVVDRGADGVNLDFEPIVSGYADEFTAFVKTLRSELDKLHPGYQLTFDTTGWIGNYPIEAATAPGAADAIFIMGYDYRGATASYTGSIAPLQGPTYDITDTIDAYTARVPASKLILGVPYYGRAWSTSSTSLGAKVTGACASAAVFYDSAVSYLQQHGRRYDPIQQVAWTVYRNGCTGYRQLYVDDVQALGAKYDLVNRRGLRGVGIWALGYDGTRPELYKLLADKFVNDTTPPVVGIEALPPQSRDEGVVVSWTGFDDSTITGYDVQVAVDGGGWTAWRTGTTATSGVYLGRDGHSYAFRVRATDSHGNVSAWDVTDASPGATLTVGGFGQVVASSLTIRSAASTSATALGSLPSGTAVAITGGPVSSGGYTWYQVTAPITEWQPVAETQVGVWVAADNGSATYLSPRAPLNVTTVRAGIRGLTFPGTFSPNGDGVDDSLTLSWNDAVAFDSLSLVVRRPDGSSVGTVALGAEPAGNRSWSWNGSVDGSAVPGGTYVLQLVGSAGGTTYEAPSPVMTDPSVVAAYRVTIDPLPITRLAGTNRYGTAAAISAAAFPSGAPVAYLATGLNFPDALAGAVAAARDGGPLLLVDPTSLPSQTKTELARLHPSRIVVLGSTTVVSNAVASAAKAAAGG